MSGIFYGVGVGPGDPELLTLKAIRVIQAADVIIAPQTEKNPESVALSISRSYITAGTEILKMIFPMISQEKALTAAWKNNEKQISDLLQEGKKVVFLTLGDPMLYSTYIYVYRLLKESGYPLYTIPGISSFSAISSFLGYPLAEGDEVLSILPATADDKTIDRVMAASDSVVLLKVYKNYKNIVEKLDNNGLLSQSVMVSRYGLEGQKIVHSLKETNEKVNYLSTILARKCKNSCSERKEVESTWQR